MRSDLLLAALVLLWLRWTALWPSLTAAWSIHPVFRVQSEALLQGRFALGYDPQMAALDLVWHEGAIQQVWGLGIPLVRLPFDALLTLVGGPSCPDRLVLALLIWGGLVVLRRAVDAATPGPTPGLQPGVPVALAWLATAPLVAMVTTQLGVYEEAVLGAVAVQTAVLGLAIDALWRPTPARLAALSCVAGVGAFFRPTAVITALSLVGAVATSLPSPSRPESRRSWLALLGPFAALSVAYAATNTIRFGAPLEAGHSLNLSGGVNLFNLKFGSAWGTIPFAQRAHETLTVAFLTPPLESDDLFRAQHPLPGQTDLVRYREIVFRAWDPTWPIAALAAAIAAWRSPPARRFAVASIGAVAALLLMYTALPAITSRYLLDLMPGLFGTLVAGILALPAAKRPFALAAIAVWSAAELAWIERSPSDMRLATAWARAEGADDRRTYRNAGTNEVLRYDAEHPPSTVPIPFNGQGWNPVDGSVAAAITLFLTDVRCVHLIVDDLGDVVPQVQIDDDHAALIERRDGPPSSDASASIPRSELFYKRRGSARPWPEVVFVGFLDPSDTQATPPSVRMRAVDTTCPGGRR